MPETERPDASPDVTPPGPPPHDGEGIAGGSGGGDGGGRIVDLDIERELRDSYLTYAMSTIMDRALPDIRDGLKPSQRRILKAMYDLKLWPGKKHLKCAKIAGDTSGNYHPHGESVIYPTLVGMAQRWRMRVPLIDPQGNFGSIEGDPPAAMRYTEARMSQAAVDMLADLELDTVDLQPNYDDRLMEPTVLPGKFPNLLVNGSIGIAVGMATSLAPHNPTEVLDSIIRTVENPEITLAELMQDVVDEEGNVVRRGLAGPDFPTGGVILGRAGLVNAYATGRGRATVRGVCRHEESGNRDQVVIESIPYGLAQNNLVEKIVEAVKDERLKDVSDVRNESGRQAQTRIVIELKRGADPNVVENQLYQFTPLQQTFSIMNIALVNRQPRTLTLKQLIEGYIEHRVEVIRRRTAHLLREARKRAHLLEGEIYAVCDIDEVIKLIRASRTREEAIQALMERRFRIPADHPHAPQIPQRLLDHVAKFEDAGGITLTRVQAERIGSMRLIQLVGLEIEKIVNEYRALVQEIEEYEAILADHGRVLAIIREDCEEMKARYGSERRTTIQEGGVDDISLEHLIQVEDMVVTISHGGYAKRVALDTYRSQGRGGKGIRASDARDGDFIEHIFVASTHDNLMCFTDSGRVFKLKVYELPELGRTSRGRAMVNLLDLRPGETPRAFVTVEDFESGSHFLTFVTRGGIVKRTPLKNYRNVHRGGMIAVGLKDGDELLSVKLTRGTDDLLLVTAAGQAIRFAEENVRPMGRTAAGVKGIELGTDDGVVGAARVEMEPDEDGDLMTADPSTSLLTITENGYGKRTLVDEYRVHPETGKPRSQSRGGKGRADIKTTTRNGRSVAAIAIRDSDDFVVLTQQGLMIRQPAASVSRIGRGTQGVRIVRLNEGDRVSAAARVEENGESEAPPPG